MVSFLFFSFLRKAFFSEKNSARRSLSSLVTKSRSLKRASGGCLTALVFSLQEFIGKQVERFSAVANLFTSTE